MVRSDTNILVVSLTIGPKLWDCIVITVIVCIVVNSLKPIYMHHFIHKKGPGEKKVAEAASLL